MTAYSCPHCGNTTNFRHFKHHVAVCIHNPVVAAETRRFLRVTARAQGKMLHHRAYDQERTQSLPSSRRLINQLGSWANVALWAGLWVPSVPDGAIRYDWSETDSPHPLDYSSRLVAYEAWRARRSWDLRHKCYVVTGWQKVYVIR